MFEFGEATSRVLNFEFAADHSTARLRDARLTPQLFNESSEVGGIFAVDA